MRIFRPFVLSMAVLLVGCASTPPFGGSSNLRIAEKQELPPPYPIDLTSTERPYLIGAFDKLEIDVYGVEEMSKREVQADASGRISFPLIGVVEAAGHTPGELGDMIAARLRGRFIRDPQVTVNLTDTVSQVVTVDGEVREPGLYPIIGRMTLMRAVARAKGATEFARLRHVAVFRTVQGQRMAALYDLRAIRNGVYDDPEVFANDVVVVGEDANRRFFRDAIQLLPSLTGPLVFLLAN